MRKFIARCVKPFTKEFPSRARTRCEPSLWEASVPSPANSPASHQGFWPSIIRTVLVEVFVLLVLSGAIVGYLKWSSDAAWAEFIATGKLSAPGPTAPIQNVKGQAHCDRSA
jgi:hypothetical protein